MAASLIRFSRSGLIQRWQNPIRLVSTSPKKNDTAVAKPLSDVTEEVNDFTIEAVRKSKQWVSYGFSITDREEDRRLTRAMFFLGVSVITVGYIFWWGYLPDRQLNEWAQREAYITLREREKAGLVPIAADYVDPSTMTLPSDEELGDADIII